jgi:hypothetical protein
MVTLMAPVDNPRTDGEFVDRVLNDLLTHRGKWRRLTRLYVAESCLAHDRCNAVRDAVEVGRRLGLVIEGDRRRGYMFVRFERPWWSRVPGPRTWPPPEDEPPDPSQLRLVE